MPEEIKLWIIEVSYGYNCVDYYAAYASKDPLDNDLLPDEFFVEAENSLWDQYSWTVLGWNDEDVEGETEEEREEFVDQAHEDFISEISYDVREAEEGETDHDYAIVYDERNHD